MGKEKSQTIDKQQFDFLICDLVRILTLNLYSRNVVLYTVELRSLITCKFNTFFYISYTNQMETFIYPNNLRTTVCYILPKLIKPKL